MNQAQGLATRLVVFVVGAALALVLVADRAAAQQCYPLGIAACSTTTTLSGTTTTLGGTATTVLDPSGRTAVLGITEARRSDGDAGTSGATGFGPRGGLARTGAFVVPVVAAGFGLVALGLVLRRSAARRVDSS